MMKLSIMRKSTHNSFIKLTLNIASFFYKWYKEYQRKNAYKANLGMSGKDCAKAYALAVDYVYLSGVEGDIVEFGTQTGRSAYLLAKAIQKHAAWGKIYKTKNLILFNNSNDSKDIDIEKLASLKKLLLFDSFDGLPEIINDIDKNHPFVKLGGWQKGSLVGLSPKELARLMYSTDLPKEQVQIFKGWFKDKVQDITSQISLIHIDCDLYQSTIDALDWCFGKELISKGTILLFDDWNMAHASPKFGERKAWHELVIKYHIKYSDAGSYSWNAHKFIVHEYEAQK